MITHAPWKVGDRLKPKCNFINNTQPDLKRGEAFVVNEDIITLVNQVPFLFVRTNNDNISETKTYV